MLRSPVNKMTNEDDIVKTPGVKRRAEKSNDDIYELLQNISTKDIPSIKADSAVIKKDIADAKKDLRKQIDGLQSKVVDIEMNFNEMKTKIQEADEKAENAIKMNTDNKKFMINLVSQSKLEPCMDITGIDDKVKDIQGSLTPIVTDVISSFGIKVNSGDIVKTEKRSIVYKGANNVDMCKIIVTVTFKDLDTKLKVMKAKFYVHDTRKIFFNVTMTATNSYYDRKCRKIATPKGLKTYFSGGFVRVKLQDGKNMVIDDDQKLKDLENYDANIPTINNPSSTQMNISHNNSA